MDKVALSKIRLDAEANLCAHLSRPFDRKHSPLYCGQGSSDLIRTRRRWATRPLDAAAALLEEYKEEMRRTESGGELVLREWRAENTSVNAVRAIAALLVVVSHARNLFFQDYSHVNHGLLTSAIYALAGLGRPAVIVFFVLSGYWVGGSVLRSFGKGSFKWTDYAVRRGVRLWIVLIPALLLTAIVDRIGLHYLSGSTTYHHGSAYIVLPPHFVQHLGFFAFLGNVFFIQALHAPVYGSNGSLWSLSFEFWFYVMFPITLSLFLSRTKVGRLIAGAALALIVFLMGVSVVGFFCLWLLGAGVAARQEWFDGAVSRIPPRIRMLLRLTILIFLSGCMFVDKAVPSHGSDLIVAIASSLLLATLVTDVSWSGVPDRLLRRVARFGANSSYSLYAIHLPLLALTAAAIIPDVRRRWTLSPATGAYAVGIVVAAVAVAWTFAFLTEHRTDSVRLWISSKFALVQAMAIAPWQGLWPRFRGLARAFAPDLRNAQSVGLRTKARALAGSGRAAQ